MFKTIPGMNWYIAKIVYQVVCGEGNHVPQFDEQFRIIRADELEWAWEKAQVLGRREQCSFPNSRQQPVQWRFIDVVDVFQVDSVEDGAQLYSETEEPENAEEYISQTRAKAERFYGSIDLKMKSGFIN